MPNESNCPQNFLEANKFDFLSQIHFYCLTDWSSRRQRKQTRSLLTVYLVNDKQVHRSLAANECAQECPDLFNYSNIP